VVAVRPLEATRLLVPPKTINVVANMSASIKKAENRSGRVPDLLFFLALAGFSPSNAANIRISPKSLVVEPWFCSKLGAVFEAVFTTCFRKTIN